MTENTLSTYLDYRQCFNAISADIRESHAEELDSLRTAGQGGQPKLDSILEFFNQAVESGDYHAFIITGTELCRAANDKSYIRQDLKDKLLDAMLDIEAMEDKTRYALHDHIADCMADDPVFVNQMNEQRNRWHAAGIIAHKCAVEAADESLEGWSKAGATVRKELENLGIKTDSGSPDPKI